MMSGRTMMIMMMVMMKVRVVGLMFCVLALQWIFMCRACL